MRRKYIANSLACFALLFLIFLPSWAKAEVMKSERSGAQLQVSFQHLLSNFSGPVRMQLAQLSYDPSRKELYTLNQGTEMRIFNSQGMEIYSLGSETNLGFVSDMTVGATGEMYLLTQHYAKNGIRVLNYRGEFEAAISLNGLPEKLQSFVPDRIEYHLGQFYLLSSNKLQIVIADQTGKFIRYHDLGKQLEDVAAEQDQTKKKLISYDINGFNVGPDGTIYMTAATLFSAFRLHADGRLDIFGRSGSGPGKFGVVAGIASDSKGNVYVSDMLRSVVMLFNPSLEFLGEFGYRGDRPEDMIVPNNLVVDSTMGYIYVSQAANKGVGVYKVNVTP